MKIPCAYNVKTNIFLYFYIFSTEFNANRGYRLKLDTTLIFKDFCQALSEILKKNREKWLADFCNLLEKYPSNNIFENKKGANYKLIAKSQFSLNSNGYFSKRLQKSASLFSQIFFIFSEISEISVASVFKSIH